MKEFGQLNCRPCEGEEGGEEGEEGRRREKEEGGAEGEWASANRRSRGHGIIQLQVNSSALVGLQE
eukprot:588614-Hanusia_phi.AAC.1